MSRQVGFSTPATNSTTTQLAPYHTSPGTTTAPIRSCYLSLGSFLPDARPLLSCPSRSPLITTIPTHPWHHLALTYTHTCLLT
mmetsp:Transcript_34902/g.77581  ORF Transcript_34902/g.77581 Transcript_34902/m.77581 type:complete len:83 (-) Transcript_34902:3449-3697(-)